MLELNKKLRLWVFEGYNRRPHRTLSNETELISPEMAYNADMAPLRLVSPETLLQAFLWEESRKVDKSGCISLKGKTYDTGMGLLRKTVVLRFSPLDLSQIQVYYQGQLQGEAHLLELSEKNGVLSKAKEKTKTTKSPRQSAVLRTLAKKEKNRLALDVGAFSLSRERE